MFESVKNYKNYKMKLSDCLVNTIFTSRALNFAIVD